SRVVLFLCFLVALPAGSVAGPKVRRYVVAQRGQTQVLVAFKNKKAYVLVKDGSDRVGEATRIGRSQSQGILERARRQSPSARLSPHWAPQMLLSVPAPPAPPREQVWW